MNSAGVRFKVLNMKTQHLEDSDGCYLRRRSYAGNDKSFQDICQWVEGAKQSVLKISAVSITVPEPRRACQKQ